MYALGYSYEKMRLLMSNIEFLRYISLKDFLIKGSLISHAKFYNLLSSIIKDVKIEDLPIKLLIYITDKKTSHRKVISKGSLFNAIIASCAYPLLIESTHLRDHVYIDGDILNSFSENILKKKGDVDVCIGLEYINSQKNSFGKIFIEKIVEGFLEKGIKHKFPQEDSDYIINYEAGDVGYIDFNSTDLLIDRGYSEAKLHRENILKLIS